MALRTPSEKEKGNENPLINSGSHGGRQRSGSPSGRPRFRSMAERRQGGLRHSNPNLRNSEENPGKDKQGATGALEEGLVKGGLSALGGPAGGGLSVLSSFLANKRKTTTTGIAITAVTSLLFLFSIGQGPLQFVQLAQLLQKFHFSSNENFGNDRASKVLLYRLIGAGAQNGRLGVMGNVAANRWEKRLLDDHGLRPVYVEPNRRFVGFEIVDGNKAQNILGDAADQNSLSSRKVEKSMGKGAEIRTAGEVSLNGNNTAFVNGDGSRLPNDRRLVWLGDVRPGDRRAWIRTILRASNLNNIASTVASRLLIKRFGVNFHPMNKLIDKWDKNRQKKLEKEKELEDKRNKEISEGIKNDGGVKAGASIDSDDDDDAPDTVAEEDLDVEKETRNYINEFKNSGVFRTGAGATVIIGVLCAAKGFGDGVEDYKYQNNVLPMTRLGMDAITRGNQVMSGDDLDLDTLSIFSKYLYDKDTKSNWTQAQSIRAELGKEGGKPISPEADLRNATDKPKFFDVLDDIPFLGTTCNAVDGFFNLPIIKEVSGVINTVTQQAADAALSLGGTSTDELMEMALKVVSGKSVDPEAKGADFGNLANTGAFLAANDNALSMGGAPLSDSEVAELDTLESSYEKQENQTKSFADRYLDITDPTSLLGSAFLNTPSSFAQLSTSLTSSFTNVFSSLYMAFPTVSAAPKYNYGVPKYGFSISEMNRDEFENPYENAAVVEPKLDKLNDKYGECFGIRITSSGIESAGVGDEELNMFKRKDKCDPDKNNDFMYLRYRFYIADVVTATSLACYEGSDEACGDLSMTSGTTGGGGDVSGSLVGELAWPVPKNYIDSNWDWFTKPHHDHPSADIPVDEGTDVYSMTPGKVTYVCEGDCGGYGYVIAIDYNDALFRYQHGHPGSIKVKVGDEVEAGQLIMKSGNTGASTGPHLHVSIETGGDGASARTTEHCPQDLFKAMKANDTVTLSEPFSRLPTTGCVGGSL